MNDISKGATPQTPRRIGILLADMGKFNRNIPILQYLVLHMNTLQKTFEFEFLPVDPESRFIQMFSDRSEVETEKDTEDGEKLRKKLIPAFLEDYQAYLKTEIEDFEISDQEVPEHFILVTTAQFRNNYFSMREPGFAILALSEWERRFAPPSLIEYILTLILRDSVALVSPSLEASVHLGTKGCLCDFSQSLDDVRLKVLNGFVCSYCQQALKHDGFAALADELEYVLKKDWLGNVSEPFAPARLAANMGYNLFITKGFIMTRWEKLRSLLTEQFLTQLIALIAATIAGVLAGVIVAYLLIRLGLHP